nr:hypothetical protein [Tanacetum cinerariifolium]
MPASPIYDRYQSGEGYHAVLPPYTGTFMPPKPDLGPLHLSLKTGSLTQMMNLKLSILFLLTTLGKTFPSLKAIETTEIRRHVFCKSLTHLIKDYNYYEKKMAQTPARNHAQRGIHQHYASMTNLNPQSHVVPIALLTRSKLVPLTAARPVTTAVPHNNVIRPSPAKTIGTKPHSPLRRTINHRSSPPASNFPPNITTVKAPKVNAVNGV